MKTTNGGANGACPRRLRDVMSTIGWIRRRDSDRIGVTGGMIQMAKETLRVVARITARPDQVGELKSLLLGLVEPTRAESGCISYEVCQSEADPCDFVCVEEWMSGSAIDRHMATPHVQKAFARTPSLLAKAPDINRYSILT
jgi:quinol monooxygenase YgiN